MSPTRFTPRRSTLLLLAAFLLLLAIAGCSVNPATGHREFTLVTPGQEQAIGKEGYPATVEQYGLYDDTRLAAYVDSVGQRVAAKSELPTLGWHFTVLDDPVVNAFAMPGGYIYVTRGILVHLGSEAQLAGVLGHEIGHVTARHSAKQITQQQLASLGLAVGGAFSPTLQRFSGAAQQALGLLMLKYSRDDETQADALGIRYATAAGYDPREIPKTYATLKRISERAGSSLPGFLSTHPDPGDREARTTALADQAVGGRNDLAIRAHGYLDHLRGVAYGDDPRQGWVSGSHFTHPTLGFELDLPAGWKAQNSRAALMAMAADQKAALQWTVAANAGALSPEDYVAALRRDGRISGMEGQGETIGGGFAAWAGHVSVTGSDGTTRVLYAAWVRVSSATLLQCLGQSAVAGDANERAIAACVRSLRYLPPARRDAQPDRVRVKVAPSAGTVQALLTQLGPSPLSLEDFSILNGVATDDRFVTGDWIKVVEAGKK